ncbi:bile acid:sodium symporter [Amylibacter sp. IMCC11727]|uniref:bile acid:sodium symporter family protein n=1 Tax=Amylibacter sp. IMCC11727 TaxID=3039851 RepID=UPI00244DC359|nr:bile acid:sodium symporter [Amylibacter sp. IMCC11727]WGI22691.1 bile acid:sodium symporter [Amylibacter sp. IMCC11727]
MGKEIDHLGTAMGNILIDVVLPLALAFIMFTLGLGLKITDFTRVFAMPKAFAVGIVNQMILLPIVGFCLAIALGLSPEIAVGMMILALAPGGVTTNVLAKIGGGNTALSISLTAVVTIISAITLPIIIAFSVRYFMGSDAPEVNTLSLSVTMFLMTVVPVVLGMGVTALSPSFVDGAGQWLGRLAVVLFAVIVLAAILTNLDVLFDNIESLGPATILLMGIMLTLGLLSAKVLGLSVQDATTVAVETGVQNSTLGIAVGAILAGQILGGVDGFSTFALPSAMYGVLMYFGAVPFVLWRRSKH